MNSISPDLELTMELCSDFEDNKLPTLSFSLFMGPEGMEHTYFEKQMKNQVLLVERSSISRNQLMSIMSNEMRRRLEVIGEKVPKEEKNKVVNKYIQQLINSDYNWKQIHEIVVSGLKGNNRREKRREKLGIPKFRSGKYSLRERTDKKLLEKYNWFKQKRNETKENEKEERKEKERKSKWSHYKKKKTVIGALLEDEKRKVENPPKAVIFVQNTENSELATEIRKIISDLKPWTTIGLKVV